MIIELSTETNCYPEKSHEMIIDLEKQGYPFGTNIHFAYHLNAEQFLFIHPGLTWVVASIPQASVPQASVPQASELTSLIDKIHADDLPILKDALKLVEAGKFQGSLKFKLQNSGEIRWLQVIPFLGSHNAEGIILGNVIDITDEVVNNESSNKYTNKKDSILYMLIHDLRGPLNMAKSVIGIVDIEVSNAELFKKIQYIKTIIQQAIELINNLISREFMETAGINLVKKRVDVVQKLSEYIEECRRSAALAERSFIFSYSAEKIFIDLDVSKFMQVVNNLISNSMKFTRPGGTISINITEKDTYIRLEFADDGIGISKEDLNRIFDKFTSASRPGLSGEPTLGLGLSIVKTIIEWHGGKIWCESEEGKGTTFFVDLPKQSPAK